MALFFVGNETFGIVINKIKEIVRVPVLTSVPNAPHFLVGLANLRGKVLPIIDARKRLGIEQGELSDASRVLIIENSGNAIGILVDRVKGVNSIEGLTIEEPPTIISNEIDRKFIKSIIKNGNGEKIIMEIDTTSFCVIDHAITIQQRDLGNTASAAVEAVSNDFDEIQMVTFNVSEEEYGFPIDKVNEVLRVGNITTIPQSPDYVVGILTVRDSVLPIVDIRKIFGLHDLVFDLEKQVSFLTVSQEDWYNQLKLNVSTGSNYRGVLVAEDSLLGQWLDDFRTVSEVIGKVIQELRYMNVKLFQLVNDTLTFSKTNTTSDSLAYFEQHISAAFQALKSKIVELTNAIKQGIIEDQRIMVVDVNNYPVGILVDRIQQVIRIPKKTMENPPVILNKDKPEVLKSIAKLENGKRIILLLDEDALIVQSEVEALKNIQTNTDTMADIQTNEVVNDEIQLVSFKLGNEEFAIGIEEVQEINRVDIITSVPQAVDYIDGVMNLRGNVIPVINLRKRFGLTEKEYDETTRVIIVTILNKQTGLIVDSVSEVLRLPARNIESTPDIMSNDAKTSFLKGVGKSKDTGKMLLLISTDKILSTVELKDFIKTTDKISDKTSDKKKDADSKKENKKTFAEELGIKAPDSKD